MKVHGAYDWNELKSRVRLWFSYLPNFATHLERSLIIESCTIVVHLGNTPWRANWFYIFIELWWETQEWDSPCKPTMGTISELGFEVGVAWASDVKRVQVSRSCLNIVKRTKMVRVRTTLNGGESRSEVESGILYEKWISRVTERV
jgi:hypothetical protein